MKQFFLVTIEIVKVDSIIFISTWYLVALVSNYRARELRVVTVGAATARNYYVNLTPKYFTMSTEFDKNTSECSHVLFGKIQLRPAFTYLYS